MTRSSQNEIDGRTTQESQWVGWSGVSALMLLSTAALAFDSMLGKLVCIGCGFLVALIALRPLIRHYPRLANPFLFQSVVGLLLVSLPRTWTLGMWFACALIALGFLWSLILVLAHRSDFDIIVVAMPFVFGLAPITAMATAT